MKYNIFDFNQEKVISLSKKTIDNGKDRIISLDVSDLLILLVISDFVNRKNIIKYTINDKTYFSVQYKVILDDLPILNIKKQALTDRINKMVYLGVIEKEIIKNQTGSYSVFRMGEEYEKIKYSCTDTQLQVQKYSTTSAEVVDYKPKDPSTNNYSTNNKESTKVDKKETNSDEWKHDYDAYKQLICNAANTLKLDAEFKSKQETYFPNVNYELSIDKGCDYWLSEQGYKKCKQAKSKINMLARLKNNFDKNRIYNSYGRKQQTSMFREEEIDKDKLIINGTEYK